jgi:1,4-dihydroxy-2-naphthoyl-CoA hydrolase
VTNVSNSGPGASNNGPDHWRLAIEDTFDSVIGLEIDDLLEVGLRTGRLAVTPAVCQPMGIVHGGVYAAIAESLASRGTADGVLELGKVPLGMSNNTSFLRPVPVGSVVHAEARAFHRGRTSWLWDVEMRNDDGKLCANSRVTIAVRDPIT